MKECFFLLKLWSCKFYYEKRKVGVGLGGSSEDHNMKTEEHAGAMNSQSNTEVLTCIINKMFGKKDVRRQNERKQESIPVGCILPASVSISPTCIPPCHACSPPCMPATHTPRPCKTHPPAMHFPLPPPPGQNDWHMLLKILLWSKLRLRAVMNKLKKCKWDGWYCTLTPLVRLMIAANIGGWLLPFAASESSATNRGTRSPFAPFTYKDEKHDVIGYFTCWFTMS